MAGIWRVPAGKPLAAGMVAFSMWTGLTCAGWAQSQDPEKLEELDEVLVVGEQPGPGLWKVSKDDHVMWVLASHSPLPRDMTWRSREVESRIGESQQVLYPGPISIRPNVGLLRGLTLIPAALKAGKNPEGETLKDVLPAETYARWLVLREKYIGKDDDVEEWRPAIALEQLKGAAFRKNNLYGGPRVDDVVQRAAKKHKVRIHRLPTLERVVRMKDPRGMLKDARKLEAPDLECFTRGLETVESGVERARARANAWARGNVGKLRELHHVAKLEDECAYVLMAAFSEGESRDAANAKQTITDLLWHAEQASVQSQRDWVAAAKTALEKNQSTFAVLPLNDVLGSEGHLEKLRALGYTVEEPL